MCFKQPQNHQRSMPSAKTRATGGNEAIITLWFCLSALSTNRWTGRIRDSEARDTLGWRRTTRSTIRGQSPRWPSRRSCAASSSLDGRRSSSSSMHTQSTKRWQVHCAIWTTRVFEVEEVVAETRGPGDVVELWRRNYHWSSSRRRRWLRRLLKRM